MGAGFVLRSKKANPEEASVMENSDEIIPQTEAETEGVQTVMMERSDDGAETEILCEDETAQ